MKWLVCLPVIVVLAACGAPPRVLTPEESAQQQRLRAREAKRRSEEVPTFPVSISCYGHGAGYIYSFSVQEPVYGQFSRRMIWGGSGNCGLVLAGYQVPLTWTPGMKVRVRWNRPVKGEDNWIEKTTAILPYTAIGNLYVHFFANDEVRVLVSQVGVLNPGHAIPPTATVPPREPN
ncbi:DUF3304 domain-containing protein [Xylophilus sp. GOD-11R]|uniref:DUF3304 domain-containing protein n=1 Tax=Xylophilus sp. GOD-11R TaxID=3089814 RepID=UPI00298C39E5|nr:DUF3304 domain-containing protein [Xylophilus sp. GOD-11R]WPB55570.1 DUF3304 domain-containing protein [Xylophilus sp. GOD-11R]